MTEKGQRTDEVEKEKVKRAVVKMDREERSKVPAKTNGEPQINTTEEIEEFSWQDKLIQTVRKIEPDQFERLCQR